MERIATVLLLVITACAVAPSHAQHAAFDDGKLTCEEMRADPENIFREGVDLGSGATSPLQVDYDCEGGLATLDFLARLHQLKGQIRGSDNVCGGTLWSALYRYHDYELLSAGLAPRLLLQKRDRSIARDEAALDYFEFWGHQSLSNYSLYSAYLEEERKARPALVSHYQRRYGLSAIDASRAAARALSIIRDRAAGSFPGDFSSYYGELGPRLPNLATLLLEQRIDREKLRAAIAASDQKVLQLALRVALLQRREPAVVDALLAAVEDVDLVPVPGQGDETALFSALRDRRHFDRLMARGADINHANDFGKTPLYYAIESGDALLVAHLLSRGADPNHRYRSNESDAFQCNLRLDIKHTGRTPLMHAAQHGSVKLLELLVEHGARVEVVDDLGYSALDFALQYQRGEQARWLLRAGATTACAERIAFDWNQCERRESAAARSPTGN